jgi:hypothetical protein
MCYSEFLEFRREAKILAKFLTALIFGSFYQEKEHILLRSMPFTSLMTISTSRVLFLFPADFADFRKFLTALIFVFFIQKKNIHY